MHPTEKKKGQVGLVYVSAALILFYFLPSTKVDSPTVVNSNTSLNHSRSTATPNPNSTSKKASLFGVSKPSVLDQIRQNGELVVLTRNAPTVYYDNRDGLSGPEYELASSFANWLGVQVKFVENDNISELLSDLNKGKGHIAAAGLSETADRRRKYYTGPGYQEVKEQLVCRRGGTVVNSITDLQKVNIAVMAHSSYVSTLRKLKKKVKKLTWKEEREADVETLLEDVWNKKIDCTIADSNIVAINRRYHPELIVNLDLTEPTQLVWYMQRGADELQQVTYDWFRYYRDSGQLAVILERYYGFVEMFDYVDIRKFSLRVNKRLPKYRHLFEIASKRYNIPWTLLAAQSYQESYWSPRAISPTGVRGMMMLTLDTAKDMKVSNRLDAAQSILGGAKYLNRLRARLDKKITEPDRTWIALAAYNVGMGHIYDAQALAEKLRKNPYSWNDLKTVLPLLSQKKYYKSLKRGYARGMEPVRYVTRIRDFEDLLLRQFVMAQAED